MCEQDRDKLYFLPNQICMFTLIYISLDLTHFIPEMQQRLEILLSYTFPENKLPLLLILEKNTVTCWQGVAASQIHCGFEFFLCPPRILLSHPRGGRAGTMCSLCHSSVSPPLSCSCHTAGPSGSPECLSTCTSYFLILPDHAKF